MKLHSVVPSNRRLLMCTPNTCSVRRHYVMFKRITPGFCNKNNTIQKNKSQKQFLSENSRTNILTSDLGAAIPHSRGTKPLRKLRLPLIALHQNTEFRILKISICLSIGCTISNISNISVILEGARFPSLFFSINIPSNLYCKTRLSGQ